MFVTHISLTHLIKLFLILVMRIILGVGIEMFLASILRMFLMFVTQVFLIHITEMSLKFFLIDVMNNCVAVRSGSGNSSMKVRKERERHLLAGRRDKD